jgi:hypothetical protein
LPPPPPSISQSPRNPVANQEAPLPPSKYDSGNLATQDTRVNNQTESRSFTRTTITTGP